MDEKDIYKFANCVYILNLYRKSYPHIYISDVKEGNLFNVFEFFINLKYHRRNSKIPIQRKYKIV